MTRSQKWLIGISFIFSIGIFSEARAGDAAEYLVSQMGGVINSPAPGTPKTGDCNCVVGRNYVSSNGRCSMTCNRCGTCFYAPANPFNPENTILCDGCAVINCPDEPPPPPVVPACVQDTVDGPARIDGVDCVQGICDCDPADPSNCGFVLYIVDSSACGGGWGPSPTPTVSPQP